MRKATISSLNLAGFASQHNYPTGNKFNNHWGDAVTVFDTTSGTPFFFNFHIRDVGHTMIIGPTGAGKTVLMNFLCAQAIKFSPRIFFFDKDRGAEIFLRALGGIYTVIEPRTKTNFNPLQLDDTSDNRTFLMEWVKSLISVYNDKFTSEDIARINDAIEGNFKLRKEDRFLRNLVPFLGLAGPDTLAGAISMWHDNGSHAAIFDNKEDLLDFLRARVFGFEMASLLKDPVALGPVLIYLFHRISISLDGTPSIIVLDEAWALIDNPVFAPKIKDWLKVLRKLNAFVIFATQSVEDASKSAISDTLVQQTATQIFLPNLKATSVYRDVFMLTEREYILIKHTDPSTRFFLVKQGVNAVVARIDLKDLDDIINVLSGRAESVILLHDILKEVGDNPKVWLPIFYQKVKMFKTKLSLLLIAIFLLNIDFLLSYPVFADEVSGTDKTEFVSRFNSTGSFSRASNPDCGAFKTAAALAGIAIAVGAIFTGIVLIVSSAGLFTAFVIVGMIAAIGGVWKAIGGIVVCEHSFVKHPVARDHDGKYKDFGFSKSEYSKYSGCTNKNYQKEDEYFKCFDKENESIEVGKKIEKGILNSIPDQNAGGYYWPKNGVQYSEYIEVCHRNPLTFGNLFSDIDFDVREKDTGYVDGSWSPKVDGDLECKVLKAGQSETIHGSTFKAVRKMGRLCVELAEISTFGIRMTPWPQGVDMGCTEFPPDPIAPMCEKSVMIFKNKNGTGKYKVDLGDPGNRDKDYKTIIRDEEKEGKILVGYDNAGCFSPYVSEACYNQAGSKSLAPIPITSMIVQCIKESLDNLVAGIDSSGNSLKDKNGHDKGSFLSVAQKRLKNTVTAVLVLALILFSIKAMSGGVRSPQEMYMLIIKFALVIYFTTGSTMSHYYGELTKLSNGLSEIVLKASSESKNICNYEAGRDYEYMRHGKKISYSYLAPWDRLDCRILFYLGAPLDGIGGKIGTGGIVTLAILLGTAPVLLVAGSIIGIIFAGGQILVAIVCIFMAVLMMMVILWLCYVFILSLVALSVIVILSPLFIPMVLFQHTKGYFDGWVKELITYSLYPVILFAFLSFMFIACDKIYFKNLNFELDSLHESKQTQPSNSKKKQWFKLKDGECDKNETTLACMMQNYSFKKSSILGLFDFTYMEFGSSLIGELLKLCLVLFLFYHFLNILPNMAAELAGNHRAALGSGSTPGQMVGKALSAAKAAAGGVGQAAAAAVKKARGGAGGGGGDSGKGSSEKIN